MTDIQFAMLAVWIRSEIAAAKVANSCGPHVRPAQEWRDTCEETARRALVDKD